MGCANGCAASRKISRRGEDARRSARYDLRGRKQHYEALNHAKPQGAPHLLTVAHVSLDNSAHRVGFSTCTGAHGARGHGVHRGVSARHGNPGVGAPPAPRTTSDQKGSTSKSLRSPCRCARWPCSLSGYSRPSYLAHKGTGVGHPTYKSVPQRAHTHAGSKLCAMCINMVALKVAPKTPERAYAATSPAQHTHGRGEGETFNARRAHAAHL